jgi:ribonuclease-3
MSEPKPEQKPRTGLLFRQENQERHFYPDAIRALESKLGHLFINELLLQEALTHSTYAYEHRLELIPSNERLEFLGDAILDLVVSEFLFKQTGLFSEGSMTRTRSMIVCERNLAQLANQLEIGPMLLLGKGETQTGGHDKPSSLANAIEALFGAVFLDAGYDVARKIILNLMEDSIQQALAGQIAFDYKSRLLELIQANKNNHVRFEILDEQGPVHQRSFDAGVFLNGKLIARGSGSSKKEAEQQASRFALDDLEM